MVSVVCSLFSVFSFSGWRNKGLLLHPKLCEWDILSSFVIQCAVAQNEAVANDVCKLRLCAQQLMALLITRPVNFHFNGINYICLLIKLISVNYLHQHLPNKSH